jgi:SAM-dependent methyltransferase
MDTTDADLITVLRTPEGFAALAAAATVVAGDRLAAAEALRRAGFSAPVATAALTQAVLRRSAVTKFGSDAQRMLFTRAGLEQATRGVVAARRAKRLASHGATDVVDLGCGIGSDALAFARAGLRVLAVDRDPATVAVALANASALGLADQVTVLAADAMTVPLDDAAAVFCDPARRTIGGRRVFDPSQYSPPWDFVSSLPSRVPLTVLKLAPGIDHSLLPEGCEAEWVSVRGEVVEATCWCGPLAEVPRRATLVDGTGAVAGLTGSGRAEGGLGPLRKYLYDPDGAVVRAHLVAELATELAGTLADPTISYIYADEPVATPFARRYRVVERLPIAVKRLRAALRCHGIGNLTILKRGSALDVEWLRHQLRLDGETSAALVLTRIDGTPAALLCQPD